MHFAGEFSAEKCFYLGRQPAFANSTYGLFRLDNISKSTLLESVLMRGFILILLFRGVALIRVKSNMNSPYTFLSTFPLRIWLFIKAFVTKIMIFVLITLLLKYVYGLLTKMNEHWPG